MMNLVLAVLEIQFCFKKSLYKASFQFASDPIDSNNNVNSDNPKKAIQLKSISTVSLSRISFVLGAVAKSAI